MLNTKKCHCPYCGEPIELVIDPSEEEQEYIEDCFVCCRPIVVNAYITGDEVSVEVRSENDV
ncbi:CPXCG motif-containing cysteine-rich protein [Eionea flava]